MIRSAVPPAATETISYGMPAFRYKEVLVWFAAFSDHCSLFPTASVIEAYKKGSIAVFDSWVRGPWKKPLRGKVQRQDFPTSLGNPANTAGFPLLPPPRLGRVNDSRFFTARK